MTVIGYAFYSTFALTEKDKLMLKKILLLALLPAIAFAEELPAPVKAIETGYYNHQNVRCPWRNERLSR